MLIAISIGMVALAAGSAFVGAFAARELRRCRDRQVRDALRMLYEETADYIRVNKLGDVHQNRAMQLARDALALPHDD